MSGLPEIDVRIRKLVNAIFRNQGKLRSYFTDIFPYMRETVKKFGLEALWQEAYKPVMTADFEIDRLGLFLDRLYTENPTIFAPFMEYAIRDVRERFRLKDEDMSWMLTELKELGFEWDGKKLNQSAP